MKSIKVCIDKILPSRHAMDAAHRAIAENARNAPPVARLGQLGISPHDPLSLALITNKRWGAGRKLRVRFLDGTKVVKDKVKAYAVTWSKYANVAFTFSDAADAEIRIAFQEDGSWSYIGTDAIGIAATEPTMNFGWLDEATPDDEYSRVVIHEFGHALGCIHEHQNPAANIPWNKDAVYRYYMGPPNNWTKEQVDHNLFEKYNHTLTNFTAFDRKSIMLYPIPKEFTTGGYEVGFNRVLSAKDKAFIRKQYKKT